MIRVVLVDDHGLVRAGLRVLIAAEPGFEVVGEGDDGQEVEALITKCQPDILLLDITMRRLGGLDVLAQIRQRYPALRILMLSMHASAEYVMRALNLGADGYLIKEAALQELGLALAAVMRGEAYLSPGVAQLVIRRATEEVLPRKLGDVCKLTPRQSEVLRLLSRGCSTREMAEGLNLSVKTVETHRAQIMERLKIRDVPSLVRYAIRCGLVRLDE